MPNDNFLDELENLPDSYDEVSEDYEDDDEEFNIYAELESEDLEPDDDSDSEYSDDDLNIFDDDTIIPDEDDEDLGQTGNDDDINRNLGYDDDEDTEDYGSDVPEGAESIDLRKKSEESGSTNEPLNLSLSSEDDILTSLSTKDAFSIHFEEIPLDKIIGLPFFKDRRNETIVGLTESVRKLGRVLKPLDVVKMLWNEDTYEEDGYKDYRYILIDGYRRLYASHRNSDIITKVPCQVWEFSNSLLAQETAPLLGVLLNRTQEPYPQELWGMISTLEMSYGITPENMENLLQLDMGSVGKIKDVMTSSYEEPRDSYITREKTLEKAYSLLVKLKKEENQLLKDDNESLMDISEVGNDISEGGGVAPMSDAEARAILEMDMSDLELTSDMFSMEAEPIESMDEDDIQNYVHYQDVKNRERVNPELKKAVFERDKLTCQCCNEGGLYKMPELVFHHKIPVHAGGADSMENGATLCCNCHLQLHFFERNGHFEGGYENLPEEKKETYTRIMRMAMIAIEAGKRKFKDERERKKNALYGISYPMPGEDMELKREVYKNMKG